MRDQTEDWIARQTTGADPSVLATDASPRTTGPQGSDKAAARPEGKGCIALHQYTRNKVTRLAYIVPQEISYGSTAVAARRQTLADPTFLQIRQPPSVPSGSDLVGWQACAALAQSWSQEAKERTTRPGDNPPLSDIVCPELLWSMQTPSSASLRCDSRHLLTPTHSLTLTHCHKSHVWRVGRCCKEVEGERGPLLLFLCP